MLLQQRQSLPDLSTFRRQAETREDKAAQIGVQRLRHRQEQKRLRDLGAYVAGISLSQTDIAPLIRERLSPIYRFLIPVFFCVMGMLIDFKVLLSGHVLLFGAVYTLVAIAAKIIRASFRIGEFSCHGASPSVCR